jgi:hypothetical protein
MSTNCQHTKTREVPGSERCYSGSVAAEPYTHENRAAHGGISYTQECATCGARRAVNVNGSHCEVSPWQSKAARLAQEAEDDRRAAAAAAAREEEDERTRMDARQRAADACGDDANARAAAMLGASVREVRRHDDDWMVFVLCDDNSGRWVSLDDLAVAAQAADGQLAQCYAHLERTARAMTATA